MYFTTNIVRSYFSGSQIKVTHMSISAPSKYMMAIQNQMVNGLLEVFANLITLDCYICFRGFSLSSIPKAHSAIRRARYHHIIISIP